MKGYFSIRNGFLFLVILLLIGAALAFLMYVPIIDKILASKFVMRREPYAGYAVTNLFPAFLHHLISGRYLLWLLGAGGCVVFVNKLRNDGSKFNQPDRFLLCMIFQFPVCFVVAAMRQDYPLDRSFIPLIPLFAVVLGAVSVDVLFLLVKQALYRRALIALLACYCAITLGMEQHSVETRLARNILAGKQEQDITVNYFLSSKFNPSKDLRLLDDVWRHNPKPIICIYSVDRLAIINIVEGKGTQSLWCPVHIHEVAPVSTLRCYTLRVYEPDLQNKCGLMDIRLALLEPLLSLVTEDNIFPLYFSDLLRSEPRIYSAKQIYLVTSFPAKLEKDVQTYFPKYRLVRISPGDSYTAILRLDFPSLEATSDL